MPPSGFLPLNGLVEATVLVCIICFISNSCLLQMEAKETAEVFEEFVASFQESESSGKMFVRGSTSIKPTATGELKETFN